MLQRRCMLGLIAGILERQIDALGVGKDGKET